MVKKKFARLKRNFHILEKLRRGAPKQRKLLLKKCNKDAIMTICDLCANIVNGKIMLQEKVKKHCCRPSSRALIRTLASRDIPIRKKKQLVQKGGFFQALIPVLGIAASIITDLLVKG